MASATPRNGHDAPNTHAVRRIPIRVDAEAPDHRRYQRKSAEPAKKDIEPLVSHGEKHVPFGVASNREIAGHEMLHRDRFVPPPNWIACARRWWPEKTAAHLAALGARDERTAKRWLAGELEPPLAVVLKLQAKLFERG